VSLGANVKDFAFDGYLEANATDVVVNGAATGTRVDGARIRGYLNHSAAAGPCVTLDYCLGVEIGLRVVDLLSGEIVAVGAGVEGYSLLNTTDDWLPYVSPEHVPSLCGPISRTNQVQNSRFTSWVVGAPAPWL
jgi:hypothetical protein